MIAAEALARWHHPDHGTVDPLRFLETVERSGLLPAFAEAVLDQALLACVSWREAGFDLPVAVNVAPRSLLDPRFPGSVMTRLRTHDLPPDRLILELTETLTISQLEVVDRVLGRLRDEGVRLALDDFGTGYSSLSVLSRIPVHELKIDSEFVSAMETSPEAGAVIRSTVDLGRSLNLAVVAEGVDSEPQRRALWEMGCTAGQGHLFARPMTAAPAARGAAPRLRRPARHARAGAARRGRGDPAQPAPAAGAATARRAFATLGRVITWSRLDRAAGGLAFDLGLYALSAGFAVITAATSTLLPHRAWGSVAAFGYAAAAVAVLVQWLAGNRDPRLRAAITGLAWVATAWVPTLIQSVERAGGRTDRAQEEVLVVEDGGSPPAAPRHALPLRRHHRRGCPPTSGCWATCRTSRVWRCSVCPARSPVTPGGPTPGSGSCSHRRPPSRPRSRWSAGRTCCARCSSPRCCRSARSPSRPAATTCRCSRCACWRSRCAAAGALGLGRRRRRAGRRAEAVRLPIVVVLLIHALTRRRLRPFALGALGPAGARRSCRRCWRDPGALVDNVIGFPLGHGVVSSPAASPFPGHLIAAALPGGRLIAAGLLGLAGAGHRRLDHPPPAAHRGRRGADQRVRAARGDPADALDPVRLPAVPGRPAGLGAGVAPTRPRPAAAIGWKRRADERATAYT